MVTKLMMIILKCMEILNHYIGYQEQIQWYIVSYTKQTLSEETRFVATRERAWGEEELDEDNQKVQISSYK